MLDALAVYQTNIVHQRAPPTCHVSGMSPKLVICLICLLPDLVHQSETVPKPVHMLHAFQRIACDALAKSSDVS